MERSPDHPSFRAMREPLLEPPSNPKGGRTLVVDAKDPHAYLLPSEALKDATEADQVFVRPGVYEDKVFVADQPVRLIGAGRDHVQVFCRRSGPLYLQRVPSGLISGITFRYVGSDQHSAMNLLDSQCIVTECRAMEGLLSGVVIYGPEARGTFIDNEVCYNRESGIFVFAGAQPRVAQNACFGNHHFGMAVRDPGSHPEFVRNHCLDNMLSGMLLFHHAEALLLNNVCRNNQHWGIVMTPECRPTPPREDLAGANELTPNPRGPIIVTEQPLVDIGR
ncbi:MAG: right-handed parallel beta-helix repeat-containing protein [Nitrospiraceae bacterium]|nr:right-handed parallel beta-helix repeat-containing protein [Nitrospiraceae bacterium]